MNNIAVSSHFQKNFRCVLFQGDCLDLLATIPDESVQLIVTSPPYNIGKPYEKRLQLDQYLAQQALVIRECYRVLSPRGHICWQVGNYVHGSEIVPLDVALYPTFSALGLRWRNRIVWHFEHGLHCSRRFSGRYETVNWFTKTDDYFFNLDPVRIPQKYQGKKYFKGPRKGEFSCNPLGKNPSDVWIIPNVKSNHVEKMEHPCQFPVELIERLVLSMTQPGDWVLDPFAGTGTTHIAALIHDRRAAGAEILPDYHELAAKRIWLLGEGRLPTRPMDRPVYDPSKPNGGQPKKSVVAPMQPRLLERSPKRQPRAKERKNA